MLITKLNRIAMTIKIKHLFAVVLFSTLASCAGTTEPTHHMDTTSPTGKAGVNISPSELATTIDLICNMDMANMKIADTAHYNGGIYAFCSSSCKDEFKKEPTKYVKQ